jgi:hypothetical protein
LHYRNCLRAIETNENIDHAAVRDTDIVVYLIKLTIERHPSVAGRASRPLFILQELRLSTKSMPRPNLIRCPFEFWQTPRLIV